MRWIKRFLAALAMLSVLNLGTADVARAAETAPTSDSVTISGIVLARRQVVVDPAHGIIQIFSNTDEDVTPEVTLGSAAGPAMAPDAALTKQYERLVGQFRPGATGLVYQQTVVERVHAGAESSSALAPLALLNVMLQLNRAESPTSPDGLGAPARLWPWLSQ